MVKRFLQIILRFIALRGQDEHVDPQVKNAFRNRVEDYEARYKFASRYVKNKKVLDIACGEGYGSKILSKKAKSVTGVDLEVDAIKRAKERYLSKRKDNNITYVCADGVTFLSKSKQRYDVIVSLETIEHVKQYKRFLTLLIDHIKPGGMLVLSTPNKKFNDYYMGGTVNPYHLKEFYTEELASMLRKLFGSEPTIYCQGPVSRRFEFISGMYTFFTKKSDIKKHSAHTSGLNNIFIVKKNTQRATSSIMSAPS